MSEWKESRRQSGQVGLNGAYGAAPVPVPRFRIRIQCALLISYESQLADAEDLVENRRDEESGESDYKNEENRIYHPTRILRNVRQRASRPSMPRASIILIRLCD